jgi:TonB-linked SusC/RagA family outer membrane protein
MQEFAAGKTIARRMDLRPLNCLFRKYRMAVRIMKLTTIILLTACLQLSARGIAQTVTISVKDAPLLKVLKAIEKQTDFVFFISSEEIKRAKNVSITAKNLPLQQVLDLCFKDQPLTYTITGKLINIIPRIAQVEKSDKSSFTDPVPQSIDVSGKVMDEGGSPLAGANVVEKGKQHGTTTDADGVFVLKGVDENGSLEISYIGYQTLNIPINKRTSIVVSIKQSEANLTEVVINKGYYTEAKRFSTGNVAQISSKEIEQQPVQNPLLALQGRVPGIEITQLTGLPGGGVTVRIQGQNSLRSNALDPLIVIDGVPYPSQLFNNGREDILQGGSPLNFINPSDIESITVLKDADATSIYGSRAANGAILVTTKKGKAGKPKININLQQGWGKVVRHVDMMNTRQYLDMRYEAYQNDGINLANQTIGGNNYDLKLWDTTRYTDWQKTLIGGTAQYTNLNTSISGGTGLMQYLIGGTYRKQTTVFPGNFDDKSGGVHFNINTATSNQKFRLQASGSYNVDRNHIPGVDLTSQAVLLEPIAPALYNANGTLNWAPDASGTSTWNNPLAYTLSTDYIQTSKSLVSNAIIGYSILSGLELSSSFGYNNVQNDLYRPTRLESIAPEIRPRRSRTAIYGKRNMSTWIIEPQLKYSGNISKGKIEGLLGTTFQQNSGEYWDITGSGYANDLLMKSISGATTKGMTSFSSLYKYNALFGRLNYNWDSKYIINLTARRDGSSRFGDKNKFHNFWSTGIGWIFSGEKWMRQHAGFLTFGKMRASYGTTGSDQIGDYQYISTYGVLTVDIPYQNSSSLAVSGIPNPYLQWEETRKWQGGIDLGFIRDRIVLGVTYAKNESSNQLLSYKLPVVTGASTIYENFPATIRNTSWEFTLNTVNIKGHDINWTTSLNFTIPRNKLVSFPNIALTTFASGTGGVIVGQPLGTKKVYPYAGVDPATGKYLVVDTLGNITSTNAGVKQNVLVNPASRYYGGVSNSISYKGFQLDFTFQLVWTKGPKDMYYNNGNGRLPGNYLYAFPSNEPVTLLNRWKKPDDNVEFAKYTTLTNGFTSWPTSGSDVFYSYDASYVRLKNLSLSWQLPHRWMQKAKFQNCLFYFRGENLMTVTQYPGLDPETRSINTLPPLQMWTVGVKVEL